jgi:hypothetical protein
MLLLLGTSSIDKESCFGQVAMSQWIARNWQVGLVVLVMAGASAAGAFLLWKFFTTPFNGTGNSAKIAVGGLGLIGVLVTAIVSLLGIVLKQGIDRRTFEISKGEQRRMQLQAAVQTVQLMTVASGAPAPPEQVSAALLVLAKLGEVSLAIDLTTEMWPQKRLTGSAAVRIMDYAFSEHDSDLQRSAALLLFNNVSKLDISEDQYEWPTYLESWPMDIDPDARTTIALALLRWIKERPPSHAEDFRVRLLQDAQNQDSEQIGIHVQSPTFNRQIQ